MEFGLGDFTRVWTPASFATAVLIGFGFGYLVIASIIAQERWRTANSRGAIAWLVGVLACWFLTFFTAGQVMAAMLDGDPAWPRIVSRLGPHLACGVALCLGTWRGLVRAGYR
jgi:hypothetical protein